MQITNDLLQKMQSISRELRGNERVTLTNGAIKITGEPKNRIETRRLKALQRKYNTEE